MNATTKKWLGRHEVRFSTWVSARVTEQAVQGGLGSQLPLAGGWKCFAVAIEFVGIALAIDGIEDRAVAGYG